MGRCFLLEIFFKALTVSSPKFLCVDYQPVFYIRNLITSSKLHKGVIFPYCCIRINLPKFLGVACRLGARFEGRRFRFIWFGAPFHFHTIAVLKLETLVNVDYFSLNVPWTFKENLQTDIFFPPGNIGTEELFTFYY